MLRAITAGVIGLVVAVLLVSGGSDRQSAAAAQVAPAMAGVWSGDARIVVNWTQARRLPVRVTIQPDGSVTGTIGDAALRDGRFEPNRTAIGRALHVKTDWIIRADHVALERAAELRGRTVRRRRAHDGQPRRRPGVDVARRPGPRARAREAVRSGSNPSSHRSPSARAAPAPCAAR